MYMDPVEFPGISLGTPDYRAYRFVHLNEV